MSQLPRNIQIPPPIEIAKVSALALTFVCIVLAISFVADDVVYLINNILIPMRAVAGKHGRRPWAPRTCFSVHDLYMVDIVGVSLVVFIFFLGLLYFFTPWMRNFLSASAGTMSSVLTLSLLFAVGLLLTVLLAYDAEKHTLTNLINSNGAWLAFFGFLITIPALFFSVVALQDLRRVINTFPDFAKRFSKMLEELKENETAFVRIMAYTPLPGALALSKQNYESLKTLIRERESRVEVICLNEVALTAWMKGFKDKMSRGDSLLGYPSKPLTEKDINDAIEDVLKLLEDLQNPRFRGSFVTAHPTRCCSMEDMPRFYAYFTDTRAIVINPLYFPLDNRPVQPEDLKARYVELIGFETTDIYTINNLKDTYKMLWDRCDIWQPGKNNVARQ